MRADNLTIVFFLLTTVVFGQVDKKVIEINKVVEELADEDTNKVVKTLDNYYFANRNQNYDRSIELSGVFKNGDLRIISCYLRLTNGRKHFTFYISKNKLILVLEREATYSRGDSTMGVLKNVLISNTVFEARYYFKAEKIIHTELFGKRNFEEDANENNEKMFIRNFKEFRTALQK